MAYFRHEILDKNSGLHELVIVNQQFDYLAIIYYDKTIGNYTVSLNTSENLKEQIEIGMKYAREVLATKDNLEIR